MKVTIAFDADPRRVGKTEDVPEEHARIMVNEGRARYAATKADKPKPEKSSTKPAET